MNDHKQGWVSREQISIPPIEKKGYPSMVLIRPTTRHVEIKLPVQSSGLLSIA